MTISTRALCAAVVLAACGPSATSQPAAEVVEPAPSGAAVEGAWEQVAGGQRFCLVFCPGDKLLVGGPGCADDGAGNFVPGTYAYTADSLQMSGAGTTTTVQVQFGDPNDLTMTDDEGTAMQFERADLTMSVCDAGWDPGDVGPAHHSDRDGDGIADATDQCPDDPEDKDNFQDADGCPDNDNDGDGVPDYYDRCPSVPEDYDNIEDGDGCPEKQSAAHDRDYDGIADVDDYCPDDAEDFDGWGDNDGCPDPDNDRDGILDWDDMCPNHVEDYDGYEDYDGCPDPDNDGDGLQDMLDACPNEPETVNGNDDTDGCPD